MDVHEELLKSIPVDKNGKISAEKAEKLLVQLDEKIGTVFDAAERKLFIQFLDANGDGKIDFKEFKNVFLSITN